MQGGEDGLQFFSADRLGPSPAFPAASGCLQPGPNAFLRQRAFILGQRSKDTQQECPLRDGGIHLFGQGAKRHALHLEGGDNGQEMRQRATESVQSPDDQAIAGPNVVERLLKSKAIIPRPAGLIFKQMPHINASGEQGGTLEVRGLPMVSLETRMYPTSMSEKLLFACFRLSEQSDMFIELILPGCDRGVKAPWHSVGKPLVAGHADKPWADTAGVARLAGSHASDPN